MRPKLLLLIALSTLLVLPAGAVLGDVPKPQNRVSPARAEGPVTLTVFAASSLTDAFTEIASTFQTDHPGVEIVFNFGASSSLATQLSEGAPADVFASANEKQMDTARQAGRIAGEPSIFARNRLVLIVPSDNPAGIRSLRDLAQLGVLLVVAAPGVPVRDYTDTMLERLAATPGYGAAYRTAVLANVVSEEDNVRQVAVKVALGEADAGIVYQSDITPDIDPDVQALPIPDESNVIAAYPIAITDDSAHPDLAQEFVETVLSADGQVILARWHFLPADSAALREPLCALLRRWDTCLKLCRD
jgi:molybdate transport system substrate-binding protein